MCLERPGPSQTITDHPAAPVSGAAISISSQLRPFVVEVILFDERIMLDAEAEAHPGFMSLVVMCAAAGMCVTEEV